MRKRILLIAVSLLIMIPAALSYAGGGLLSGFPSSAEVGDSVTWTVDPGDEEGDLEVDVSGASVSVSGNSFTVKFDQAGTVSIRAGVGDVSDSCTVTVTEAEDSSGDEDADSGEEGAGDSEGTGDDSEDDEGEDTSEKDEEGLPGGEKGSGNMPSGSGGVASGTTGSASSSTDSKTTYAGSADNYLESLFAEGFEFTQAFNKTNDTYFMTAEYGTDSIEVIAEASDDDAEVIITGTDGLTAGRNKIMVSVTAENGDVRVYRIYVDVK